MLSDTVVISDHIFQLYEVYSIGKCTETESKSAAA